MIWIFYLKGLWVKFLVSIFVTMVDAVYLLSNTYKIPHEDNILVSVTRKDLPFGVAGHFREDLVPGLRIYEINSGYMEVISVEQLMKNAGINEKTIFYGLEDIATQNIAWKIFSLIKRISPAFIQFHKLPAPKLHGVVTRVEL
jgi:KUP system potassium uptake protein